MRYYEINPRSNDIIRTNLSNMDAVLREVSTTYRILYELLQRHRRSVNIPELDEYRDRLELLTRKASLDAAKIAADAARFAEILAELDKEVAKSQMTDSAN